MKVLIALLLLVSSAVPAVSANPVASQAPAASPTPLGKLTVTKGTMSEEAVRAAMAGTKWMHGEREDQAEGRKVFFTIFAPDFYPWRAKLSHPRISIVCSRNPVSARIYPAGPLKDGNVKITFDNGTILRQKWNLVDGAGVPSPDDEAALFKGLATAKSLKFEATPSDEAANTYTFNMGDYRESVLKEPLCKK